MASFEYATNTVPVVKEHNLLHTLDTVSLATNMSLLTISDATMASLTTDIMPWASYRQALKG
jgi:hypothetical protein